MQQRFLVPLKRSELAQARILCFPYAGGHAAFAQGWARRLPAEVELFGVSYPKGQGAAGGRSVQMIAAALLEEVLRDSDQPLIFLGYSLGSLVAYELSLLLARQAQQQPAELVVAACRAPHLPRDRTMTGLPNAQFIERLRALGGTPEEVLANTELLEFFLPVLRTDIATAEMYVPSSLTALDCAITAIAGSRDATTQPAQVAAWQSFTRSEFRLHELEGHHFVIQQQPEAMLAIVRDVVQRRARAVRCHDSALGSR